MAENYVPEEQEILQAEDTMLPYQVELTEKRLKVRERLAELGVEGLLVSYVFRGDGSGKYPDWHEIRGALNSHDVRLAKHRKGYDGIIDGLEMSRAHAKELWLKYAGIASLLPDDEIQAAAQRLHSLPPYNPEHEEAATLLKDIL